MMQKKKHYIFIVVGLALILVAALFVWWHIISDSSTVKYRGEKVHYGNLTQTVSANGTLNPVILVNVGTQVSGQVQKIYADFNDRVAAGQILLELDPTLLKAAVQQSLAQVNKAKSSLSLAMANEKRNQKLVKQGYISKQDWDTIVQTRISAVADLTLAEAQLEQEQTNLNYTVIRSPVSGVIVDRQVDVGQTVAASFQTPVLFKIAQDLSKMQIDTSFAEADIGDIKPGQEATFTVDAFPERNFVGVVKQIRLNPTVQQNVVTYDVVVLVENKDGVLLPGMTAYVSIKTSEHKNVLLIPNSALRFHPKKEEAVSVTTKEKSGFAVVYKIVANKLQPVSCRIGMTNNRFTEILSGDIKAGDDVAIGEILQGQDAPASAFRVRVF